MSIQNNQTLSTSKDQIAFLLKDLKTLSIPDPLSSSFEEPKRYGDYTRLEEGENPLRILCKAIIGCEYWTEEFDQESGKTKKKPIRRPLEEARSLETSDYAYFYAFFVWNYKAQKIQILCTTKKGIMKGLKNISKNPNWGEPTNYDICISKIQTDPSDIKSVEYSVTPEPHKPLDLEISKKWEQSNFSRDSLLLLFEGLNPFEQMKKAREEGKNLQVQA